MTLPNGPAQLTIGGTTIPVVVGDGQILAHHEPHEGVRVLTQRINGHHKYETTVHVGTTCIYTSRCFLAPDALADHEHVLHILPKMLEGHRQRVNRQQRLEGYA